MSSPDDRCEVCGLSRATADLIDGPNPCTYREDDDAE
jgi:hypothetical protein